MIFFIVFQRSASLLPGAAILNVAQCKSGTDDVSWLLRTVMLQRNFFSFVLIGRCGTSKAGQNVFRMCETVRPLILYFNPMSVKLPR